MAAMSSYEIEDRPLSKSGANSYIGIAIVSAAAVGAIVITLVLLGWRDPFDRLRYESGPFFSYMALFLAVFLFALLFQMKGGLKYTVNPTNNSTMIKNSTLHSVPILGSANATGIKSSTNPSPIGLDALFLASVAGLTATFGVFAAKYYKVLGIKRKRKEMARKAKEFDEKLDHFGLELFDNPREAVIGIYKNAVLWLNSLGIPYLESWTHWEHAEHVRLMRETFTALTRLFEKAEYAPERITWDDAKKALELYLSMRRGLNELS
ncbi:DUF4129 domain-containing protein [Thermococcus gorgonarius]|nr:DUF4129 domain-containing protein [Thermococcus gorgonarius]